jgi:hypothetical protein
MQSSNAAKLPDSFASAAACAAASLAASALTYNTGAAPPAGQQAAHVQGGMRCALCVRACVAHAFSSCTSAL